MRISDWSSDVCSSDLRIERHRHPFARTQHDLALDQNIASLAPIGAPVHPHEATHRSWNGAQEFKPRYARIPRGRGNEDARCSSPAAQAGRSEEHPSELQSLMRLSYAVFCLKKKQTQQQNTNINET